jgi:hypothetical protein
MRITRKRPQLELPRRLPFRHHSSEARIKDQLRAGRPTQIVVFLLT